jgi:hypothetical protein
MHFSLIRFITGSLESVAAQNVSGLPSFPSAPNYEPLIIKRAESRA